MKLFRKIENVWEDYWVNHQCPYYVWERGPEDCDEYCTLFGSCDCPKHIVCFLPKGMKKIYYKLNNYIMKPKNKKD